MTNQSPARGLRLSAYAALAGSVIPATSATAQVIGETGLDLLVTPGNPEFVDFGPDYGEIFRFSVRYTFDRGSGSSYVSHLVQFDNNNAEGWTDASLIRYSSGNDPARLSMSSSISAGANWFGMQTNLNTTAHDLATFTSFGSGRQWAPNLRGFVGLRITTDAGANYNYAWIDVEITPPEIFRGGATILIHGWGLETTPNTPIPAGAPAPGAAGLALLAMGAAGIRRQRRTA